MRCTRRWTCGAAVASTCPHVRARVCQYYPLLHRYAHQGTAVYMLTELPEGTTRKNGYDESGWTSYERCSAEQIKKVYLYEAKWKLVLDLGASAESGKAAKARRWPYSPDDFDQLISGKTFTNGADKETVKQLYHKMSTDQLGSIRLLDFTGIDPPTVEDAERLGRCLNLCQRLDKLDLNGVGMNAEVCKAMCSTMTRAAFKELECAAALARTCGASAPHELLHFSCT